MQTLGQTRRSLQLLESGANPQTVLQNFESGLNEEGWMDWEVFTDNAPLSDDVRLTLESFKEYLEETLNV